MSFRNRSQGRTRAANGFYGRGGFDADAQSYFTATGLADPAFTVPINQFILDLKAASLWSKFDRLWIFANPNPTAALICIKSLETATAVNAPTFTAGQGYTFNGSSQYIDSGFAPDDGINYTLNAASYGCFIRAASATGVEVAMGTAEGVGGEAILYFGFPDANSFYATVNNIDALTITTTHGGRTGLWQMNRSAAGAAQGYKTGASVDTGTTASGVLSTASFFIGARHVSSFGPASFFAGQFSMAFAGGSFDATEAAAFNTAVAPMKTAIGF